MVSHSLCGPVLFDARWNVKDAFVGGVHAYTAHHLSLLIDAVANHSHLTRCDRRLPIISPCSGVTLLMSVTHVVYDHHSHHHVNNNFNRHFPLLNCGKRVWSMIFSLVLYMILASVVSAALFHVLVHHNRRDCCNCFTILHYSYEMMDFWSCKLANLSNQKSFSYWQWQQVCTFMSICHEGPKMLLLFKLHV